MRRTLFATAVMICGALAARAEDSKAQPKSAPASVSHLEEDFERAEAHRDVRKAKVKVAEIAIEAAKAEYELATQAAGATAKGQVNKAKFDLETAKAKLEIRQAQLREAEVKVKHTKKRLDEAKAGGAKPTPNVNFLADERALAELQAKLEMLTAEAAKKEVEAKKAEAELKAAEAVLAEILRVAQLGRIAPGTIEKAEAKVAEAKAQTDKLARERKALEDEIAALKKKIAELAK